MPRAQTTYPRLDPRVPHHAPVFGAQAMPGAVHAGELSGSPKEEPMIGADGQVHPHALGLSVNPNEPVPEVITGYMMGALSGGVVGGLAASSWNGAAIGALTNVSLWGAFTLTGSWRDLGGTSRTVLGVGTLLTAAGAVALLLRNRKKR